MKRRVGAVFSPNDLILIRHGVTQSTGRLCGRTDVGLSASQPDVLDGLVSALAGVSTVITSPAQRCVQTADLIWGQGARPVDPRLWEQDFGAWENMLFEDIPDIGVLEQRALARHRPPQGESFLDLCDRVKPAFEDAAQLATEGPVAIVAHAGVIRAAVGFTLGKPASGLGVDVSHLSVTRLRCLADDGFSMIESNWHPS
ncbi:MAG: histidine phosphatase family protein [Paracoccaceae bacterium]